FGLQFALVGGGPGAENFQDQQRAVQHFHLQRRRKVADLAAGQFAVKDGGGRLHVLADQPGFLHLAGAQQGGGFGRAAFLHHLCHGVHAVGFGQGAQFRQAAVHIIPALVKRQQHHRQRVALGTFLGCGAEIQFDRFAHITSLLSWKKVSKELLPKIAHACDFYWNFLVLSLQRKNDYASRTQRYARQGTGVPSNLWSVTSWS